LRSDLFVIALIAYWLTRANKVVDSEVAQKRIRFWVHVRNISALILAFAVVLIVTIVISTSSSGGDGWGDMIAFFIIPPAFLAFLVFRNQFAWNSTSPQVSRFFAKLSSGFAPHLFRSLPHSNQQSQLMRKKVVAEYKESLRNDNRRPIGTHTLAQLVIAASAGLVVIGIVVFGVISYFGTATSEGNKPETASRPISSAITTEEEFEVDRKTVENLKMVQDLVVRYYQKAGRLPSMSGHLSLVSSSIPYDYRPGGEQPTIAGVEYVWHGNRPFELCANFNGSNEGMVSDEYSEWQHGAGKVCFERDIQKILSSTPNRQEGDVPAAAVSTGVSMTDFFKNTDTCTVSSFISREDDEHPPDPGPIAWYCSSRMDRKNTRDERCWVRCRTRLC
jgi:hypothetical protein